MQAGAKESGIYTIYPSLTGAKDNPVVTWCDLETYGGGWTVSITKWCYHCNMGVEQDHLINYFNENFAFFSHALAYAPLCSTRVTESL